MLFNSWEFLILLVLSLGLYYGVPAGKYRKVWQVTLLLVASAVFYAWEEPRLLVLLSLSCLLNALAVERILFWKGRCAAEELRVEGCGLQAVEVGLAVDRSGLPVAGESSSTPPPDPQPATPQHATSNHQPAGAGRQPATPQLATGNHSRDKARSWLFCAVALNLGALAFFKYAGFLSEQLPAGWLPAAARDWLRDIPLPVGISFYTFQGISLVVDVWRNEISESTARALAGRKGKRWASIRDTSFYISFFPQLVAGPIVKAHEFVDQIGGKRWREIQWMVVRRCLIAGYFLKIFVADNLAEQTAALTLDSVTLASSGPFLLLPLLYGYSLQIFADFAGYSLIAIGLGALFGYRLPENFRFPYLSCSITEFWRRWHLSLSSWLRDYLYIPLGGNRKGSGRTYFNLFLVMFLGGLWHGAAWKFAIWGSLHGLFLALERLLGARRREQGDASEESLSRQERREQGDASEESLSRPLEAKSASHSRDSRLHAPSSDSRLHAPCSLLKTTLRWFVTFHVVTLLWLTFLMPDLAHIRAFFEGVFSGRTFLSGPPLFSLLFYGTAVVLYHAWGWLREHRERLATKLARSPLEPVLHGVMIFLILTNPGAPRGFIYFQF
jgi:alginate O-acetyltransferase complex protein AlgI